MQTSREDVGIAFRSALLAKGAQQRIFIVSFGNSINNTYFS